MGVYWDPVMIAAPGIFEAVIVRERPPETNPDLDMTMMSLFFGAWWVRERASTGARCDENV